MPNSKTYAILFSTGDKTIPKNPISKMERENIELKAQIEILETTNKWSEIAPLVSKILNTAMVLGLGYIFYSCVAVIAGKVTFFYLLTNLFANISIQAALAFSLSGASIAFGFWQRRLKKRTTEVLHVRIKELEESIDTNRTSSGLTKQGETNPKDRI